MAAAKRPLLTFFLAAAALYAGVSFVQLPLRSAAPRTTEQLALGMPATLLMFPDASYAKVYTGAGDVLFDKEASYALGIEWLSWNAVYIGIAIFCAGAIFVFPVLASVILPAPRNLEDVVD